MAVATVTSWRVREGKLEGFIEHAAQGRKLLERHGGEVRVWQVQLGAQPGIVSVVVSHEDMRAYGEYAMKLQADEEWQRFLAEIRANPAADLVANSLISEVPGV